MQPEEQVALAPRTTLGVGGAARWFVSVDDEQAVPEAVAWARRAGLPWLVLGGGSNLLVSDRGYAGLVLHMALRGLREPEAGVLEAAAGEDWDTLVAHAVARGYAGLECLSGIPGTVGATPVQNVGAYGQEVAETIEAVRAWDSRAEAWVSLEPGACGFAYRASRFNGPDAGRFVIVAVRFRLRSGGAATLRYPELRRGFPAGAEPTLAEVRAAVRALRRGKGMLLEPGEPESRSAGSFFKNPVLPEAALPELARRAGAEPPRYPAAAGEVKVPAAWLLERAGFARGFALPGARARLSQRHVLAIVNPGGASSAEIVALARHLQAEVERRLGVRLQPEPVAVGFAAGEALA